MQVVCWNAEKLNKANMGEKLRGMVGALKAPVKMGAKKVKIIDWSKPWAVVLTEVSNAAAQNTATDLASRLGGSSRWIDAGGKGGTKESVVLVTGGGCTVVSAEADNGWGPDFDDKVKKNKDNFRDKQKALDAGPRSGLRQTTKNDTTAANSVSIQQTWDSSKCRNPVVVKFNAAGEGTSTFAFVHSPGPSSHALLSKKLPYAQEYFDSVMNYLHDKCQCVMGDFNIYGDTMQDKEKLEHFEPTGTTFSSKTCELTKSELDRVFVTKSAYNRAEVGLVDSAGSDVSDHAALFAELVPAVPVAQTGSETAFTWRNISLFAVVAIATVVGLASAIASGSGSGSGAASGEG